MASPPELHRGTVTFLFTDIEGSTRLLVQLGDRYGAVLAEHRRILREAAEAREGREIDAEGDSFFFAFARANAALGAAVVAQRALAEHAWPEGVEVRVRMGLHTGEPVVEEEGYVGLGVHRAARIGAVGHGGQVLLSSATRELVEDEVGGVSIRELGSYRLKDIDRPERLFQLEIDGLQTEFPPLKAEKVAKPRPVRRRTVLAGALAGVIAAAVAIPIFAFGVGSGGSEALAGVDANAVGLVGSGTGKISAEVPVGETPTHIAVGEDAIWVTNTDGDSVSRIDPVKRIVVDTIPVGKGPSGIALGDGFVWVTNSLENTVSKIDPNANGGGGGGVVDTIRVGNGPAGIVYAAGSIWVANTGDDTITRIDAGSDKPGRPLPIAATELAFGAGTLWASDTTANRVVRIDPATGTVVAPITVGRGPLAIAFGAGVAWVVNSLDGTVSRIDPVTNSVAWTGATGNGPADIAADARGVWVTNQFDGTLLRIDPRTNRPGHPISVGNRPRGVAVSGGNVLVSVLQSGAGHRGGTLTMRMNRPTDSIDTALAGDTTSIPFLRMTGDGLVAFDQASGLQGTQLVPDLAVSLPTPTDDGRTYTFRLRPGIRYSNGRLVKASDVSYTLERDVELGDSVGDIVGAAHCEQTPKRCDLSHGVVANDAAMTVTFHLVAPDPEFMYNAPFASVVPAGTPAVEAGTHQTPPLPATGPYLITSYRKNHSLTLGRNPYFHEWSKAAQPDGYPDRIVVEMGGTPDGAVDAVIRGKADAFSTAQSETPPSESRLAAIETRYASQVRENPQPATIYLFLNTRLAPFDRLDVRRALNYAADRGAAVSALGGPVVAQATCQILPPYSPGYRPYCPYTAGTTAQGTWTAPDLARARALVARSGTSGMKITVWSWADLRGVGPYTVKLLQSLGYRVTLKQRTAPAYWYAVGDSRTKAQIGTGEWISDYPQASGFYDPLLTCASFLPDNPNNTNYAGFCNPRIDRQVERAQAEEATNPDAARELWESIDRQTVDQAPWVPLANPKVVDVLSKRVGNYQYSLQGGMLIDQLWVR